MRSAWDWIIGLLVWLSAEPASVERELPAASAAVSIARASLEPERPAAPKRCAACDGKGYTVKPSGRFVCPVCKGCPDGQCER